MAVDNAFVFDHFVATRGEWLARCAYLLTHDREAALDLVQETLMLAWKARDRVAAADNPEHYILRIMLNAFRSAARVRKLPTQSGPETWRTIGDQLDDPTAAVDDADVLERAMQRLPRRQQAVLVLRYWADVDDQAISNILGCRPATVRSLAARGLARIKQQIGEPQ